MKLKIILIVSLLLLFMNTASAGWVSDPSIVTGLGDVGGEPSPEVYDDSGTWKLISGNESGYFNGFYWNGTSWVSDSSIVTGLGDIGAHSTPAVFNDSGTWKLIAGNASYHFTGFYWNGTSWVSDSSIVAGLGGTTSSSRPEIFYDSGVWKLISGGSGDVYSGFQWNGTSWVSTPSIVTGLGSDWSGGEGSPTVYDDSGTWKLITGMVQGETKGYYWSGSTWQSDSSIVVGLPAPYLFFYLKPTVFNDTGTLKLIFGEGTEDKFHGFYLNTAPVTSSLKIESKSSPAEISTNTSAPYFTWTYTDAETVQTHWQIYVGTTSGASDMWNSGQLSGTDTSDTYAGSTLTNSTTYYVQVRTKDGTEWSAWTTGTFIILVPIDDYTVTVTSGQNTALLSMNTSFPSTLPGTTNDIAESFNLTNTGNAICAVSATFTTYNGSTYGLDSTSGAIGGANFSMAESTQSLVSLDNLVSTTSITGSNVAADAVTDIWKVRLAVPAGQAAATYTGTVELTFTDA